MGVWNEKRCNQHVNSNKHKIKSEQSIELLDKHIEYKCINCNKIILSRTTLWRHSKTCTIQSNISQSNISQSNISQSNEILEQNKKYDQLTEQNKQILEKTQYLENLIIELSKNLPIELSKNLPIHNTIDNNRQQYKY